MFVPLLALAAASASPVDPGFAALRAADTRLANVAWRLQTANVGLCSDVRALPGFTVQTLGQYPARDRARVTQVLGLGTQPAVAAVARGSAAERAGLMVGDVLVAIDGVAAPGEGAGTSYDQAGATEDAIDAALTLAPAELTVEHNAVRRTLSLPGDRGCASRVQLIPGSLDGYADGQYVQIASGMYDFVQGDDELAVIVAHELAHNILEHSKRRAAAMPSKRGGQGKEASRRNEHEADRLSVWLVARAGFDEQSAVRFWARYGKRTGLGIFSDGTHPRTRDKVAGVARAVAEVRTQRAAGQPLVPPLGPPLKPPLVPTLAPVEQTPSQPQFRR